MLTSLDDIDDLLLDDLVKGIPGGTRDLRLGDVGKQGWNILAEDLPLPVAVLKADVLDRNDRWMAGFLSQSGAVIAPHGKTTMSPQLFDGQIRHGAWAITVATVGQLQVALRFGHKRIILANQPVGKQALRYIADQVAGDEGLEIFVLVDSLEGAHMLADEAERRQSPRPISVLLEGGVAGGRTGCRDIDSALEVARAVSGHAPWLALRGVEGFEGLVQGESAEAKSAAATAFVDFLGDIARACQAEGLFAPGPVILSAGGSTYYDIVVDRFAAAGIEDAKLVTRSGCYLSQDSSLYAEAFEGVKARSEAARSTSGGLAPALEVWAYVQSLPEPSKAVLTAGRRDLSHDAGLPVPLAWYRPGGGDAPEPVGPGVATTRLHDQHAELEVPQTCAWHVGDMVSLGISHPCTTFDKWQVLFLVDGAYNVTGAVRTFF